MVAVGLKALKNQLSKYVRVAAAGEVVLVTDRDRVVAELTPPCPGRSALLADELLADAVARGLIRPAEPGSAPLPPRRPTAPWREVAEGLAGSREDR